MTDRTCTIDGCSKPHKGQGFCSGHLNRWRRYGDPLHVPERKPRPDCSADACERPADGGRGWCEMHYQRWRNHGDPSVSLLNRSHDGSCSFDGCDRRYHADGLCEKHSRRRRVIGTLTLERDLPTEERFWLHVVQGPVPDYAPELGPCWLWTGNLDGDGYGRLATGERGAPIICHRWSFEALRSDIPEGLDIDHLCRVRRCVNAWHLDPVTPQVNSQRMHEARRAS